MAENMGLTAAPGTVAELEPKVYPECSVCGAPYVLRRMFMLEPSRWSWAWQPDCKHKIAAARLAVELPAEAEI